MWYLSYIMYSLLLLYISFIFDSLHKGYKYVLCIMYAIFLRADNHRQILLSIRLDPRRPTSHKYRHNSSAFLVVTVVICLRLIYPRILLYKRFYFSFTINSFAFIEFTWIYPLWRALPLVPVPVLISLH